MLASTLPMLATWWELPTPLLASWSEVGPGQAPVIEHHDRLKPLEADLNLRDQICW